MVDQATNETRGNKESESLVPASYICGISVDLKLLSLLIVVIVVVTLSTINETITKVLIIARKH